MINVRDDAEWAALRQAMDEPAWARDARFATGEGRIAAQDALDTSLRAWTAQHPKRELAERLQRAGVPCGPMLTAGDQLDDPQLAARGYPRPLLQQDLGPMTFEGPCFRATGMSDVNLFQAPRLGEHTEEICRNLLHMEPDEIAELLAEGALEGPPGA